MIENEYGQPVGEIVENLSSGSLPQVQLLQGRFCRLEKLSAEKHGSSLREVYASPPENWTYLSIGPITDADGLEAYLAKLEQSADPYWFAFGFLVHFSVSFDYAGHPIRYNGFFCLPCASKLSSDSQSRKRRLRSGHSLSITEYQLVSRLRPRLMRSWRKVPS